MATDPSLLTKFPQASFFFSTVPVCGTTIDYFLGTGDGAAIRVSFATCTTRTKAKSRVEENASCV